MAWTKVGVDGEETCGRSPDDGDVIPRARAAGRWPRDLRNLAADQHRSHRERADEYERIHRLIGGSIDRWQLKSLELGIRYERTVEGFWAELLEELPEA
jgi:hypothetical protein